MISNNRKECCDLLKEFHTLANEIAPNLQLSNQTDDWPGHSRDHDITQPLINEFYRKENVIEFRDSCAVTQFKTRKMTVQGANEVWFDQIDVYSRRLK